MTADTDAPTPRTDYAASLVKYAVVGEQYEVVSADFARQLERELIAATQRAEMAESQNIYLRERLDALLQRELDTRAERDAAYERAAQMCRNATEIFVVGEGADACLYCAEVIMAAHRALKLAPEPRKPNEFEVNIKMSDIPRKQFKFVNLGPDRDEPEPRKDQSTPKA